MTKPTIRHYPKRKPPEPDLKTLGDAANEAAKREAAQWFFFVTIMLTLAAIVGSTTHRVLFLEEPVKVPILAIELPLLGFYWAAPAIFLVLHFYLLAQVREMAGKVEAFLDAAEKEARGDQAALRATLRRLDPFPVVGLMAARRFGRPSVALWLMVWTTLAVVPVLLLLFVQVRFLAYHDVWLTMWHRAVLALDLAVLWWLWPRGRRRRGPVAMVAGLAVGALGTALVLGFSVVLATVPGEKVDRIAEGIGHDLPAFEAKVDAWPLEAFWWRLHGLTEVPDAVVEGGSRREIPDWERRSSPAEPVAVALRRALFDGSVDPDTQRPRSPLSRSLVLPDQDFLTPDERKAFADNAEKARETIGRTRVLRGRDLRDAVLDRTDLRRADLTGADLRGAALSRAKLNGAWLDRAQMQGASLGWVQMQGASLDEAQMQGASLISAQMQGALLDGAQMQGAWLFDAQMQGASLRGAQMQGAAFDGAQMQGASLGGAQMQGASLIGAQMQGASLNSAQMQGASLAGARLQGASLDWAQMQGASLEGAQMQGTSLVAAEAWRIQGIGFGLEDSTTTGMRFVGEAPCPRPDFRIGACTEVARPWSDWIEEWLIQIPDGPRRENAKDRLWTLEAPDDPAEFAVLRARFRAQAPPSPMALAQRLGDLACDPANAPHVARGILREIGTQFAVRSEAQRSLAARIAGDACPGARGLAPFEFARLATIAAGRD